MSTTAQSQSTMGMGNSRNWKAHLGSVGAGGWEWEGLGIPWEEHGEGLPKPGLNGIKYHTHLKSQTRLGNRISQGTINTLGGRSSPTRTNVKLTPITTSCHTQLGPISYLGRTMSSNPITAWEPTLTARAHNTQKLINAWVIGGQRGWGRSCSLTTTPGHTGKFTSGGGLRLLVRLGSRGSHRLFQVGVILLGISSLPSSWGGVKGHWGWAQQFQSLPPPKQPLTQCLPKWVTGLPIRSSTQVVTNLAEYNKAWGHWGLPGPQASPTWPKGR